MEKIESICQAPTTDETGWEEKARRWEGGRGLREGRERVG